MNPEFRRNLWIEFSDHRLVSMPVILGAIFLLTYLMKGGLGNATGVVAMWSFSALIFLWGTRMAAESVLHEVHNKTWDIQRMSAISAWQMAWGKLFGSTSYAWYGALMCLGLYIASNASALSPVTLLTTIALYIGSGIFAHAICLLASLQTIQRRRTISRVQVMSYQFLGLICAIPILRMGLSGMSHHGIDRIITWYGEPYPISFFMLCALAVFMLWSLMGVFALMRTELQQTNKPWLWLGFVVFAMVFFAGIYHVPSKYDNFSELFTGVSPTAYIIAVIATYVMVFSEPKDQVQFRRLGYFVQTRQWEQVLSSTPRSILTLPIVIGAGVAVALFFDVTVGQKSIKMIDLYIAVIRVPDIRITIIASVLFVLRDVAFIYFMSLGQNDGRGDSRALLYLVLLYTVVPALLLVMHLKPLLVFFWPQYGTSPISMLLPIIIEITVILYFLRRRWQAGPGAVAAQPAE